MNYFGVGKRLKVDNKLYPRDLNRDNLFNRGNEKHESIKGIYKVTFNRNMKHIFNTKQIISHGNYYVPDTFDTLYWYQVTLTNEEFEAIQGLFNFVRLTEVRGN